MILYAVRDGFKETTRPLLTDGDLEEVQKNHIEAYESVVGMKQLSEEQSRVLRAMTEYWTEDQLLSLLGLGIQVGQTAAAVIHGEIELEQIQL